jgi:hypothetical protein
LVPVENCDRPAGAGRETDGLLAAKSEATDDLPVALDIVVADVVEKATTAPDELQEPTACVVVSFVDLEMLGQVNDALAQDGDLHLG